MADETTTETKQSFIAAAKAAGLDAITAAAIKAFRGWDDLFPVSVGEVQDAVTQFRAVKLG